jgi:hypothetical protein
MKGRSFVVASVVLLVVAVSCVQATYTKEWLLPDPPEFILDIGPEEVLESQHSMVEIWVENVLDRTRWKEWYFAIYVLEGQDPITNMLVDYDLTEDHSAPEVWIPVNFTALPTTSVLPDGLTYQGYYADSEELGISTVPVGAQGEYPYGNPWWVSYHVDVPDTITGSIWYVIHDECVPEPMTLALLAMGSVALVKRRRMV